MQNLETAPPSFARSKKMARAAGGFGLGVGFEAVPSPYAPELVSGLNTKTCCQLCTENALTQCNLLAEPCTSYALGCNAEA